jgi:hypothetical protein
MGFVRRSHYSNEIEKLHVSCILWLHIPRIFSQRSPVNNIYYGILARALQRNNFNNCSPRGNICNYGCVVCNYRPRLFPFLIGCDGFQLCFAAFRYWFTTRPIVTSKLSVEKWFSISLSRYFDRNTFWHILCNEFQSNVRTFPKFPRYV